MAYRSFSLTHLFTNILGGISYNLSTLCILNNISIELHFYKIKSLSKFKKSTKRKSIIS